MGTAETARSEGAGTTARLLHHLHQPRAGRKAQARPTAREEDAPHRPDRRTGGGVMGMSKTHKSHDARTI